MNMICGSIVALVTPLQLDGEIDFDAYRRLIDWHIDENTDAIVVVGTTGESSTIDFDDHCDLIRIAVEQAAGRIPIIAGTGGNSTAEAVALNVFAKRAGADASLSVVPYYNKPGQNGLFLHFRALAEAVDLPLILYNVPGRTVTDLSLETTLRLAEVPGIVGIKDATGNIERGSWLIHSAPPGFSVYSGDDATAAALMLLGAKGNISVTANLAPRLMHDMCVAGLNGDAVAVRALHYQLLALSKALFVESNPIPVKWAMSHLNMIHDAVRAPLTTLDALNYAAVQSALADARVLPWPSS